MSLGEAGAPVSIQTDCFIPAIEIPESRKMLDEWVRKNLVPLDPERMGPASKGFEEGLHARIVGQERAVRSVVSLYQVYRAGLNNPSRPIGTLLFLGPTGSGKTRLVEAAAEVLFDNPEAVIKIDCAEFQHSHEISKLIGSPPGYLGHRETQPRLTQENLDRFHTHRDPFTFVLFDEIEKASDALWQLLLGVLENATLTLGDTRRVDFSRTMIFLTSNLGTREIGRLTTDAIGFAPVQGANLVDEELNREIYRTALKAARLKFSPEFMNRIDKVVVFHSLTQDHLKMILDLELLAVQRRIENGKGSHFKFRLTARAKDFLLMEGTDYRYGARHLRRAIDRFLVIPFANLLATEQVLAGDRIVVDIDPSNKNIGIYQEERASAAKSSV